MESCIEERGTSRGDSMDGCCGKEMDKIAVTVDLTLFTDCCGEFKKLNWDNLGLFI